MTSVVVPEQGGRTWQEWSPARIYLVASGVFLLIVGAVGLVINQSFPTSPGAVKAAGSGWLLGLETNGWHSVGALFSSVLALAFAMRPEWASFGAMVKGVFYATVTTALAVKDPSTFLFVSNTADQIVHATLALGGIATALATRPGRR